MADAARLFIGDAEVQTNRLGMADVEIPIRFRRKAGDDPPMRVCRQRGRRDDLANKVGAWGGSGVVDMVVAGFRRGTMMKRAWFYHRTTGVGRRGAVVAQWRVGFSGSISAGILEL